MVPVKIIQARTLCWCFHCNNRWTSFWKHCQWAQSQNITWKSMSWIDRWKKQHGVSCI